MNGKPTEADRLTAALFVTRFHQTEELAVSRLAEILAAEREEARAPFLALANHLAYRYPSYDHRDKAEASREAADHIRRVVALDGGQ